VADLGAELRKIYAEYGDLTRRTLVTAATPVDHPLHDRFEWDDRKAGDAHRLAQAGALIRSVRVTFTDREGSPRKIHEFHSVERAGARTYAPLDEVREDPITMEIILREMKRDVDALVRRYGHMDEFWTMIREGLDPMLR